MKTRALLLTGLCLLSIPVAESQQSYFKIRLTQTELSVALATSSLSIDYVLLIGSGTLKTECYKADLEAGKPCVADGLSPGNGYPFRVHYVTATGQPGNRYGSEWTVYTKPAAPSITSLMRSPTSPGTSVVLTWTEPSSPANTGAITYRVRLDASHTNDNVAEADATTGNHTFTGLRPGQRYRAVIWATVPGGSAKSALVTSSPVNIEPDTITQLSSTTTTSTSIGVKWSRSNFANAYFLEWKLRGQSGLVGSTNVTIPSHTITGLTPGTRYTVTVYARSNDAQGDGWSGNYTTLPNNLVAADQKSVTETTLTVTWAEPVTTFDKYRLRISSVIEIARTGLREHTFTNLSPGALYTVRLATVSGSTVGTESVNSFNTLPQPVTNLVAEALSSTYVRVRWTRDTSRYNYHEVTYVFDGDQSVTVTGSSSITYVNYLTPGVTYTFSVRARSGTAYSASAPSVQITTNPSTVRSFKATRDGPHTVDLVWTAGLGRAENGYRIRYRGSLAVTDWTELGTMTGSEYTVSDLHPGEKYSFTITAESGTASSSVRTTTVVTTPYNPENLTVTAGGIQAKSVAVMWDYNKKLSYISSWRVSYKPQGGSERTAINTLDRDTNTLTIPSLSSGQNYTIKVQGRTVDNVLNITGTTISVITVPDVVRSLSSTGINSTFLGLRWSQPSGLADSYLVKWQVLGQSALVGSGTVTTTSHTITGLMAGMTYTVTIHARSYGIQGDGVSGNFTTPPDKAVAVQQKSVNETTLTVMWAEPITTFDTYRLWMSASSVINIAKTDPREYTFTGLSPGRQYAVYLVVMSNNVAGPQYVTNFYTLPRPVENLAAETSGTSSITLTWTVNPDSRQSSFEVEYVHGEDSATVTGYGSSSNINGLIPGVTYTFSVRAQSGTVYSTTAPSVQGTTNPARPLFTCDVDEGGESIQLLIQHGTGEADEYLLTCTGEGGCPSPQLTLQATATDTRFSGLMPSGIYQFTIKAVKRVPSGDDKESRVFSRSCSTTQRAPGPVENFRFDQSSLKPYAVALSWDEPSMANGDLYGYTLSGNGTKQNEVNHVIGARTVRPDTPQLNVTRLIPGYTYTFVIYARNALNGEETSLIVITPIEPPYLAYSEAEGTPRISHTDPNPVQQNTIKLNLLNPFSDRNSEVTEYSVIVWSDDYNYGDSDRDRPLTDSDTWYTRARTKTRPIAPYQTIRCEKLFTDSNSCVIESAKGSRRRRAVPGKTVEVTIGGDSTCNPDSMTNQYCNGPLEPETRYRIMVRAHNELGEVTDGYPSAVFTTMKGLNTDASQTPMVLIVAVVTPLGVILLLGIILFVLWRSGKFVGMSRQRKHNGSTGAQRHPVPLEKFADFMEDPGTPAKLAAEYNSLETAGYHLSYHIAEQTANLSKNKFASILPYDHSLVKFAEPSMYINASWMPGYNSRREFIVTQCPTRNTTDEFWRMVWEQQVQAIVMMIPSHTKGKAESDQYWPYSPEPVFYDELRVSILRKDTFSDYTVTELQVHLGEEVLPVTHYHFVTWPRTGVPQSSDRLLEFVRHVRSNVAIDARPVVVHCSAGVGRSGVYIALDHALQAIEDEDWVDIYGIVREMRLQRPMMVQTEAQYVFIHRCLLKVLVERYDGKVGVEESDGRYVMTGPNEKEEAYESVVPGFRQSNTYDLVNHAPHPNEESAPHRNTEGELNEAYEPIGTDEHIYVNYNSYKV